MLKLIKPLEEDASLKESGKALFCFVSSIQMVIH